MRGVPPHAVNEVTRCSGQPSESVIDDAVIRMPVPSWRVASTRKRGRNAATAVGHVRCRTCPYGHTAVIVGAGGALFLLLAFQVFRAARHDVSDSPVSQTWLSEQKRAKGDDGMV